MLDKKRRNEFKKRLAHGNPPEMVWRESWFNLNAKEGGSKPILGLQITKICVTIYLFVVAIRVRHGIGSSLPTHVFTYKHPICWPKDEN